ncbi:hypothetical protein D1007_30572 [Hordeum vulgare]|nr:hypothetical protein D1007_30572 [Hordeum vulgare]
MTTSSRAAAVVDDPSSMGIYITRWSAKRLCEIANTVKGKKRDVISKSSFGVLLHISPLPPPPEALVDFIVMRIDTKKRLLKLTDRKKIPLTRDMVKKIFNVPSGSKPLEFGKRGKADFREIYLEGERAPIQTTISVLSNFDDDDEDTIDRTWILLCLSLVLAPDAMREVKKYQDKRNEGKLKFHIGGCLPMLPVIYMDHIDIPRGCIVDHTIDYSLPRACFVKELDFTDVIAVDTMEDGFGKRPFSGMQFSSTTPYATTKFLSYIEQLAQLPNKASVSATDIPDMLSPHMRAIFNKHKDIHATELKGALSSFGSLLEGIYRKRMCLMLSEESKVGFRSDKAKHECPDVTCDVPAAPAPGMCNATASELSLQQQKQLDCTTGTANATLTISSPQQPKHHENMVQVTTATAQSTFTTSSMQQASQPNDTNSVDPGVDVPQVESPPRSPAVDIESFMEIRARSPLFDDLFAATTSPGPVYDVTPLARIPPISTGPTEACIDDTREEAHVEVSSGQGHDQKHPTLKRVAPTEPTAAKLPKMKKKKFDAMDDAIYQSPSFIRIDGFHIAFKHFSNGLKKRAHVNNEVMSLYIESFNIEHMYSSSKPRKFAFSPHVASKLYVDPSSFNPNSCTKGLKRACEKNDIAKSDQDTTSLLNFRKYIAAKLFKHPQNTLSSEEELEKLLKKS